MYRPLDSLLAVVHLLVQSLLMQHDGVIDSVCNIDACVTHGSEFAGTGAVPDASNRPVPALVRSVLRGGHWCGDLKSDIQLPWLKTARTLDTTTDRHSQRRGTSGANVQVR